MVAGEVKFIVGGVASQSYLPSVYRRPTTDIDLAVLKPLNYENFKEFSRGTIEYLQDHGFEVSPNKGHVSYQLIFFRKDDGGEAGVIEFPRRNFRNFEKRAARLEREMGHTRKKIVEGRDVTYKVSSPEDIVVPKLIRGVGTINRNHDLCRYVQDSKPVASSIERIREDFKNIQELRTEAVLYPGNTELAECLRLVSDIFDIRALSEVVGFNEQYFKEVIDSWDSPREFPSTTKLLMNYLLPEMNH